MSDPGQADNKALRRTLTKRVANSLDRIGLGFAQLEVLFLAGGVFLVEGMLLVISGIVVRTLEVRWNQSLWHTTALATSTFLGVTMGTVVGGAYSDVVGRRPAIMFCYSGSIVLVILCAFGFHFLYYLVANVILGFFFGFGIPAANALISECCSDEQRPTLVCSSGVLFAIGQVAAGLIVWVVQPNMEYDDLDWRLMTGLSAIPPVLLAPLVHCRLVESPKWLAATCDASQCDDTLMVMAKRNGVPLLLPPMHLAPLATPRSMGSDEDLGRGMISRRPSKFFAGGLNALQQFWETRAKVLFSDRYRWTTWIMLFVTFSSNFCYYCMIYILPDTFVEVMMWLQKENPDAHSNSLSPAFSLMLSAVFELPGILLAISLAQCFTRRASLVLSFSVTSISAISLVSASQSQHPANAAILTSIAAFSGKLFIASAFILVYLYLLEVYPTSIRASGLAFAMTFGRLGAFFVPLVAETLMHLTGSTIAVFLAIGLDACFAALLCLGLQKASKEEDAIQSPKESGHTPLV